ncbi:MAG: hypothetical protein HZA67_09890 [Rhodospirillales bacterium]|nr:hypothetical protein [Rhodospirillales bacterium]
MAVVTAIFPSVPSTGEARPLPANAIWSIARDARRQICGGLWAKPLPADTVIRRVEMLVANGIRLVPVWDCQSEVHDEQGLLVAGACEYDPDSPENIYLSLNPTVLGERHDLAASTAAHELGHAIFDGPASVMACRSKSRHVTPDERHFDTTGPKNEEYWSEYRANEFMGGLLAPPDLLHRAMVMQARQFGIALINRSGHAGKPGYPVIDGFGWDAAEQEALLDDLADMFGVSASFIWVRLCKYRLVANQQPGRV